MVIFTGKPKNEIFGFENAEKSRKESKSGCIWFCEALNKVEVLTEKDFGDDSAYGCVVPCKPHNIRIIKTPSRLQKELSQGKREPQTL